MSAPEIRQGSGLSEAIRLQRDIYLVWKFAQANGGLPLTSSGYLHSLTVRRLIERLNRVDGRSTELASLREWDYPRLLFIRRLLERMRLLVSTADQTGSLVGTASAQPDEVAESRFRLEAAATGMDRYIKLPFRDRVLLCARLWLAGGWWPERHDQAVRLAPAYSPLAPRVALARKRALDRVLPGAFTLTGSEVKTSKSTRVSEHFLSTLAPKIGVLRQALLAPAPCSKQL